MEAALRQPLQDASHEQRSQREATGRNEVVRPCRRRVADPSGAMGSFEAERQFRFVAVKVLSLPELRVEATDADKLLAPEGHVGPDRIAYRSGVATVPSVGAA